VRGRELVDCLATTAAIDDCMPTRTAALGRTAVAVAALRASAPRSRPADPEEFRAPKVWGIELLAFPRNVSVKATT
jgi:hypothetical protein